MMRKERERQREKDQSLVLYRGSDLNGACEEEETARFLCNSNVAGAVNGNNEGCV